MKKNLTLFVAVVILALYGQKMFKKGQEAEQVSNAQEYLVEREGLNKIFISTGDDGIQLELQEDFWWVTQPHRYPANQELVEKALASMTGAPVQETFKLENDYFGFSEPKAFCVFTYKDGLNRRYVVGGTRAPRNGLYVLNKDNKMVSVVHNVWGQFFYYQQEEFYHAGLPMIGKQLKAVTYSHGGKEVWAVRPTNSDSAEVVLAGKSHNLEKAQLLWFFNRLREIKLENLQFSGQAQGPWDSELIIKVDKGNIIFQISTTKGKISIPSLNVFADLSPSSVTSLSNVLNKAVKQ